MVNDVGNVRFEATSRQVFERHGDASDSHAQGRQAEDSSESGNTALACSNSHACPPRTVCAAADDGAQTVLAKPVVDRIVFEDC